MQAFVTKLEDGRTFEPIDWLADEILWGIVKESFPIRWDRWINPSAPQAESSMLISSWGRAKVFVEAASSPDLGLLAQATFQLGKLAASLTSEAVHLETSPASWFDEPQEFTDDILAITRRTVHDAEEKLPRLHVLSDHDAVVFESALYGITDAAQGVGPYPNAVRHAGALSEMTQKMLYLASATTGTWLDYTREHDGNFVMVPGATPRSSGQLIQDKLARFDAISKSWSPKD